MSKKIVIVGGVAGGATAAARIRRLDEQAEIVVFERSGYISYANCGLPYYVGGVITDPEELTLQDPESFYARFRVVMKVRHEVTAIHPEVKTVEVKNLETGETFTESYDSLLLAPGARPVVPDLPGIDSGRIFKLRTVEDTFSLREHIQHLQPKRAAVIGGGFIGLETAENLRAQSGLDLDVIDHYNGTTRSVKTLSGGESFIASLSLALGLSEEIQMSAGGIRMDTMFVDEGFGSLDEETLQQAMRALHSLTEGNRLIGIISHVAELRRAIDKQIVVRKEKTGGSTVRIVT